MIQIVLHSPKSSEDQKKYHKGLHRKLKDIYPPNWVKTKKNLRRSLALYLAGTGRIYSCKTGIFFI